MTSDERAWIESQPVRCTVSPCGSNPAPAGTPLQVYRDEHAGFVAATARAAGWLELATGYDFLCPAHAFMAPQFERSRERRRRIAQIDDPKEAALALIDWYVLRGDTPDDLARSHMGQSCAGYAADIRYHKVVVESCGGRTGPWTFSLDALYREIAASVTGGQQLALF